MQYYLDLRRLSTDPQIYVTLNEPEWSFNVKFCFCTGASKTFCVNFEKNCVKSKGTPTLSAAKMFSMDSIVSGDIRFLRIFAGFSKFYENNFRQTFVYLSPAVVLGISQTY